MKQFFWTETLKTLHAKALDLYGGGHRDAASFFDAGQEAFLEAVGLRAINVYDHAEDLVKYGEPDWETFLLVASARRDYFLYRAEGQWNREIIEESSLPPKTAAFEGVQWLPRIARKAFCYLEGSLCHEIMYGCRGDRDFLKRFDTHPADFLRMAWAEKGDPARLLPLLKGRTAS